MKKYLLNITQTLLVLVALLTAGVVSAANFTVKVGDPTAAGNTVKAIKGQTVEVPVYFTSDVEATAVQLDLAIPADLAGKVAFADLSSEVTSLVTWNTDRVRNTNISALNSNKDSNGVLHALITNSRDKNGGGIKPSSEVDSNLLFTFKLVIPDGAAVEDKIFDDEYNFVSFAQVVVGASDTRKVYELEVTDKVAANDNITTVASQVKTLTTPEYSGKLSIDADSYQIIPGEIRVIGLSYKSDFDAHMFQFDVTLPEGLSIVENGETFADRTNSLNFNGFTSLGDNKYIVLFNTLDTNASIKAGEGNFMSFTVKADANFRSGNIVINRVRASQIDATFSINDDEGATAAVAADLTAISDLEAINDLQAALNKAIEDVKTNYYLGRDTAAEAKLQQSLTALTTAVATETARAVAAGELYKSQVDKAAVQAEINAYVAAAKAAHTEAIKSKGGYDDAKAVVEASKADVAAAVAAIPEAYAKDANVVAAIAAANAAVEAFDKAVDAVEDGEYNAAAAAGKQTVDAAIDDIKAAVKAIIGDAAQKDLDTLDKLAQDLKDAEDAAGEYGDQEAADEIAELIKNYQDSVNQAAASADEGNGAYVSPAELMEEEIAQKIEDYQAAAAAANIRSNNQATYDGVLADINDVEETYQAALSKIESDYAESLTDESVIAAKQAIEDAIAKAKDDAKAALDAANEAPEALSYRFNAGPINVLITDLMNKAAAAGVAVITADTVVDGAIYTLDGVRHNYPVQGKINIIRKKDSSIKVFVK